MMYLDSPGYRFQQDVGHLSAAVCHREPALGMESPLGSLQTQVDQLESWGYCSVGA